LDIQVLNPAEVKLPQKLEKVFLVENNRLSFGAVHTPVVAYTGFLNCFNDNLKFFLLQSPLFVDSQFYVISPDSIAQVYKKGSLDERNRYGIFTLDSLALMDSVYKLPTEDGLFRPSVFEFRFSITGRFSRFSHRQNFVQLRQVDTLYWNFKDVDELTSVFPTKKVAWTKAGEEVGKIVALRLAPYWSSEDRVLFQNRNKYMKKGYQAYLNNNISGAIEQWERLAYLGTNRLSSYASHNIAVCYEILDDLAQSEGWLKKSIAAHPNLITQNYLIEIKKRRNKVKMLDEQLKGAQ
jgi:hypothetical protein